MTLNRRQFLLRGGATLAGTVIAGSIADQLLKGGTAETLAADVSTTPFPGRLVDDLSTVVADLRKQFPYASGVFASQNGVVISRDRRGKRVSESGFPSRGVSLRVFDGEVFHEAAVADTSPDALRAAMMRLKKAVAVTRQRYRIEPLPAHARTWRVQGEIDPASLSLAERAARIDAEFARVDWNDPRVRGVRVSSDVGETRRVFVDRERRLVSSTTTVSHNVVLFGFDAGKPGFAVSRRFGQGGLELANLPDEDLERLRREFVESFGAEPLPSGEYDVVFAPEISGLLAHESFGHGVEMDQFVKDRAKASEFLGKSVAARIVTLLDDPSVAGQRGSYAFDDEGMLAEPTTIIRDGVFVQPLTDLMSATLLGTRRTPNGRLQAWDRKVYARMSNTFFARGTTDPAEVIASLNDGLYLEGFRNGIEDPQGWGIQFTASVAREYKAGRPTGRIFSPATVTGYVPEILSRITLIGSDMAFEPGTCGKGFKEFVPVTSGGPHLRTRARVS